jgi:hypothetical protein
MKKGAVEMKNKLRTAEVPKRHMKAIAAKSESGGGKDR